MSRVRSKDTGPELVVRRALSGRGVRYRLHSKNLPGKPDLYIGRIRLAIFVNGCFWHGHECPRGKRPASNAKFWNVKIDRNQARDAGVLQKLADLSIEHLTIWQCCLGDIDIVAKSIARRYERIS
jgi:DNA mismatch endonuclease (patch repair protein)